MRRRTYGNYQGRTTARDVLKLIIGLLAVLLVLVVAALLLGQRYIVYTDDGIRLELPFFRREQPKQPGGDLSQPIRIVEVPGEDKPELVAPEPVPEPEPEPELYRMRCVRMTLDQLEAGGAAAVEGAGANTVVLDMKGEDGRLNYVSGLSLAQDLDAETDRVIPLLDRLHEAGIRVVARVSCFRDNSLGNRDEYAILTNSGYRWRYDDVNRYWTSPTNETIRAYVAGVAGELAALGFDEILLDNCCYPIQGELGWIRKGEAYDLERLSEYIDDTLSRAQTALEGTDCVLSVVTYPKVLDGETARSGQTAAALAGLSGRVWIADDGQSDLAALLEQAGIADVQERLVRMTDRFDQSGEHQCLKTGS